MSDYHIKFLIFLTFFVMSVSSDIVPEFQFPCYVDVCTFPRQYCNSDRNERRCSPCTRSLCKETDLPRACLYYCQVADQPVITTASPLQTTAAIQSKWQDKTDVYLTYTIIFIAVTNTAVFAAVIFISFWLVRFCGKNGKPHLSPMERFLSSVEEERAIELPLIQHRKSQRPKELEHRGSESGQESTKSLPPYRSKEYQIVDVSEVLAKKSSSVTESDKNSDGLNISKQSSPSQSECMNISKRSFQSDIDRHAQVDELDLSCKKTELANIVSSPTGDMKHEHHEKPWPVKDNRVIIENMQTGIRTHEDEEETLVKR